MPAYFFFCFSSLIWTESDEEGNTRLMTVDLYGRMVKRGFFEGSAGRRRRQACNCPSALTSDSPLAFDLSDPENVQVYFLANGTGDLMVTGKDGCMCQTVDTYGKLLYPSPSHNTHTMYIHV